MNKTTTDSLKLTARAIITITSCIYVCYCVISSLSLTTNIQQLMSSSHLILVNAADLILLLLNLRQKPKYIDTKITTILMCLLSFYSYYFLNIIIHSQHHNINSLSKIIGIILSLCPYPFILLSLLNLNKNLSILPEAHSLVTKGIYRITRHPLYLGYIIIFLSYLFFYPSISTFITVFCINALFVIRALKEEIVLEKAFPEYTKYKQDTPFIPILNLF